MLKTMQRTSDLQFNKISGRVGFIQNLNDENKLLTNRPINQGIISHPLYFKNSKSR